MIGLPTELPNSALWPWALLLLLPLLLLVPWYLGRYQDRGLDQERGRDQDRPAPGARAYAHYPDAALAALAARRGRPRRRLLRHLPAALYGLTLALGVLALARPTAKLLLPDELSGIILAIETSRSMWAPDIAPTRLEATRKAANELLERIPDSIPVGITTFSGYGTLLVPPTRDRERLRGALATLGADGGFAFSYGIINALQALPEEPPEGASPGVIVLFSHGHDNTGNDPLELADEAARRGIAIHTVGVGTHGNNFDDNLLKLVADRSGGRYYPIFSAADLEDVHRELGRIIALRPQNTEVSGLLALAGAIVLTVSLLLGGLHRRLL